MDINVLPQTIPVPQLNTSLFNSDGVQKDYVVVMEIATQTDQVEAPIPGCHTSEKPVSIKSDFFISYNYQEAEILQKSETVSSLVYICYTQMHIETFNSVTIIYIFIV